MEVSSPQRAAGLRRTRIALVALVAAVAAPASAQACLDVGIYRDRPAPGFDALTKRVGPGVTVVSTYVTAGRPVDPALIQLARKKKLRLLVNWMPDNGKDGTNQPAWSNRSVYTGRHDKQIRSLARQIKSSGVAVILRPMPEPNYQRYAWSGGVNGNTPETYVQAWERIRRIVKKSGGKKVRLLWAPYVRSVPDTEDNALDRYFPGAGSVDLVGASGYNFGTVGELEWTDPVDLFQDAYIEISALSTKPFWIAETGTTNKGGNRKTWLRALSQLDRTLPRLRGVVLYDIKDPTGDFRVSVASGPRAGTKAILAKRCGKKTKR